MSKVCILYVVIQEGDPELFNKISGGWNMRMSPFDFPTFDAPGKKRDVGFEDDQLKYVNIGVVY